MKCASSDAVSKGKAWNLAQMYIIPNQVNLAIVPSQISPEGSLEAILIMAAMSPYLRN